MINGMVAALIVAAVSEARAEERAPEPATWEEVIADGVVPYRQLTVADFPIDEKAHPKNDFYVKTSIVPRYHFLLRGNNSGFVFAYIDQWLVFAGLDGKETSRKSRVKNMKTELPFAQALLDLAEICAREIAAILSGELPSGRGSSVEEAQADLGKKIEAFLKPRFEALNAKSEAFMKATDGGQNKKKVRQLAAEIKERLAATPATTVPYIPNTAELKAAPSATASPSPFSLVPDF